MAFDIFPDPNTAAILGKKPFAPVALARGETMRAFVKLPQRVGPDPPQPGVNTTFVRFALWHRPTRPNLTPSVELAASDPALGGPSARLVDPAVSYSIGTGVQIYDGTNPTSAAIAYFSPPAVDNIHLLKVVIEIPHTRLWIRLTNNNAVACGHVWVVADNDEETKQAWLNVRTPYDLGAQVPVEVDAYIGQAAALNAEPLVVSNHGSGPLTIASCDPPLPAPYILRGVPLTVAANSMSTGDVTIGLDKPAAAGAIAPANYRFLTRDKPDPGPFGELHNDSIALSARVGFNNVWTERKPMITARHSLGVATDSLGNIYAIGGFGSSTVSNKVERYDPAADQWFSAGEMPTGRLAFGIATAVNGLIYVIGGESAPVALQVNEAFDPISGEWRTLAPMPIPRAEFGLVAGRDGLLYAVGGRDAHYRVLDVVEAYDPVRDSWVRRQPLLSARWGPGVAVANDGKIYAVGGITQSAELTDTLEAFDPVGEVWTYKTPMLTKRSGLAFIGARNGRLYAVGGMMPGDGGDSLRLEEYDPSSDTWLARVDVGVARDRLGLAVALTGRLYAIGGYDAHKVGPVATVQEFTP